MSNLGEREGRPFIAEPIPEQQPVPEQAPEPELVPG